MSGDYMTPNDAIRAAVRDLDLILHAAEGLGVLGSGETVAPSLVRLMFFVDAITCELHGLHKHLKACMEELPGNATAKEEDLHRIASGLVLVGAVGAQHKTLFGTTRILVREIRGQYTDAVNVAIETVHNKLLRAFAPGADELKEMADEPIC